jgi:hypothetical protein
MQEDIDQSASGQRASSSDDDVRSPIAARNDILVHPDMDYDESYGYISRGRGRRSRRGGSLPLLYEGY